MHATKTVLIAFIAGMGLLIFLVIFLLSGLSAALASMQGSGAGSCPPASSLSAGPTATAPPALTATPVAKPTGTAPVCVPPSGSGKQVVAWAQAMAAALYVNPACHGQISYPNCYYTWYKAPGSTYPPGAPDFPEAVIQYGEQVCPGCSAWANGTYQCVSFVRGAYSQVYPMRLSANAFALWALYATQPGWVEIPSGASPPDQRGLPQPGDVLVFKDASIGHVAIVMSVAVPTQNANGSITFSNANSVSPYTTMPLLPDLTVDTSSWPGYTAWGYIRPRTAPTALHSSNLHRLSLLLHFLPFNPFWNKETTA
ncbi:MAG TPA: CHAP domain-containing protein [Ktedonobacteraceae bacterium]|nr:CHAP domain-containing protein [Ktedonobacteraceae bacterium]